VTLVVFGRRRWRAGLGCTFRAFSGDETLSPMAFGGSLLACAVKEWGKFGTGYGFLYRYFIFGIAAVTGSLA
jgi:hypothetical protein